MIDFYYFIFIYSYIKIYLYLRTKHCVISKDIIETTVSLAKKEEILDTKGVVILVFRCFYFSSFKTV